MKTQNYAAYFDHTILKPDAVESDIKKLCAEAKEYGFFSVCVNPHWVPACKEWLKGSPVLTCTVVGFPLGANAMETKVEETRLAIQNGAEEIDVVINIGLIKDGKVDLAAKELKGVVTAAGTRLTKVIVESGLLSEKELRDAIEAVNQSGAAFIKTSTGFTSTGATVEAVEMMKRYGSAGLKIKASGGIRTAKDFLRFVELGVHRVGASRSVEILKDVQEKA
ncbi:MAG: deoxyribose-phosphate aldolase [Bdellovibrionaceae bacterium]|nr:deoxyribose-phosphate aldolase [Pseudobdellovibrionaceae bacterium]